MIGKQVLATLLAAVWAVAPAGRVQEVRISQTGDETEIAVITSGDVEVRDFILRDPARLILDVHGAVNELPGETFEGIGRGGVVRLRSSQFQDDVVRLVFDLASPASYHTSDGDDLYTVRFANPGGAFELDPGRANVVRPQLQLESGRRHHGRPRVSQRDGPQA